MIVCGVRSQGPPRKCAKGVVSLVKLYPIVYDVKPMVSLTP